MNDIKTRFKIIDRPYKVITFCFLLTFFGLFLAWSSVKIWIKTEANKFANEAVVTYQSDRTESLLMMIFDEKSSIEQKNMAIWTLGTLKDENALDRLEELDTLIEEQEIIGISNYELEKAILKIKGEFKGRWKVTQN
jgi:hypothetical protein